MTQSKTLSIIIPFYNVKPYLKCLFDSLLPQVTSLVELICVEDSSNDGTKELLKSYCERYQGTIDIKCIFHEENRGLSAARNTGLNHSTGQYVMFVDSDDILAKNAVAKILSQIRKGNEDIIFYDFIEFEDSKDCYEGNSYSGKIKQPDQKLMKNYKKSYFFDNTDRKEKFLKNYIENRRFYSWMFVAKKSLYTSTSVHFPEKVYFEDIYTSPKLVWNAKSVIFLDEAIIYYRQRHSGIKGTVSEKNRTDLYKSFDHLLSYFESIKVPEKILTILFFKSITYRRIAFWDLFKSNPAIDKDIFNEDLKNLKSKNRYSLVAYIKEMQGKTEIYSMILDYMFLHCLGCFVFYQKVKGIILLSVCRMFQNMKRCDYYKNEYGKIV